MAGLLRVATRGSALALRQVELVEAALRSPVERVVVTTTGDRVPDRPIHEIGGQGAFAKEVQEVVLRGEADLAVHSAKDLTSTTTEGLVIAAYLPRGDVRDALVGARLDDLGPGARVATGSVRRRAQLAALRPDLDIVQLRGNIDTRLDRLREVDAVVMAAVALDRLDRAWSGERLAPSTMVPQVGQGAIAIECRVGDRDMRRVLSTIDHRETRLALVAERAFLREFGAGCDLPVGAVATVDGDDLTLTGILCVDGDSWRATRHGAVSDPLGRRLARELQHRAEVHDEAPVAS